MRTALGVRHNAQQEGTFPKFDEFTLDQTGILERIAGSTMQQLGYAL